MPSIDVAMARSVRGGLGGIVARSLQAAFEERDIITSTQNSISDVQTAFSSWDNCMAAAYCKWPVIALIIVGALIIVSVVWCISRCLCCGLSCCCECCHCLKCCGQCCGCCDPPSGRRRKHLDEPYNNIPDSQGYKREDPMAASGLPFDRPRPTAAKAEPPQFASFDVSKHGDDKGDDLPAMPVWGDSESKKIQLEQDDVELKQLKPPEANAPLMTGMSPAGTPGTRTPVQGASPFGPPGVPAASSGYFGGAPGSGMPEASQYMPVPGSGYQPMQNSAYGQSTTSFQTEQSWGVTTGPLPAGQQEYGQRQAPYPQAQQQQGYGQPAAYAQDSDRYGDQPEYGEYGAHNNIGNMPPAMSQQGYGMGLARSMTGGSTGSMRGGHPDHGRGSPAVPQGGPGAHERAFDPRIMPQRTASPALPQGAFDPRLVAQRTGSPAQQQQGVFPVDPRSMPQRTASPAQYQQQQQRQGSFSPAPQGQRPGGPGAYRGATGPGPQRQMSADNLRGGNPPRAPPYRQDAAPGRQPFLNSPRPGGPQRMPPPRSHTVDRPEPPRSPGPRDNFSRPMRSNTGDQSQVGYGGQQGGNGGGAGTGYPGYKPYQPGR